MNRTNLSFSGYSGISPFPDWLRICSQAAVVHLNFRAGSTFPVPDCTVSPGHWVNEADTQ